MASTSPHFPRLAARRLWLPAPSLLPRSRLRLHCGRFSVCGPRNYADLHAPLRGFPRHGCGPCSHGPALIQASSSGVAIAAALASLRAQAAALEHLFVSVLSDAYAPSHAGRDMARLLRVLDLAAATILSR